MSRTSNLKKWKIIKRITDIVLFDDKSEIKIGKVTGDVIMCFELCGAKEELNINLKREDLKIEHILHHYKGNRIKFIILAKKFEGILQIGEPDKCEKIKWFNIENLPDNTEKKASKVLNEIRNGIFYDNSNFINLDIE